MKPLIFVIGLALGNLLLLLVPGQTINLNKDSAEKALARHRQRIDVLDKQIISLLNERRPHCSGYRTHPEEGEHTAVVCPGSPGGSLA